MTELDLSSLIITPHHLQSNQNTLKFTKPCNSVLSDSGVYGVCYRKDCSFAHSLEELKYPICRFDVTCYNKNCNFKHSDETDHQWMERTGYICPNLPLDSKLTHKQVNNLGSGYNQQTRINKPKTKLKISVKVLRWYSMRGHKKLLLSKTASRASA